MEKKGGGQGDSELYGRLGRDGESRIKTKNSRTARGEWVGPGRFEKTEKERFKKKKKKVEKGQKPETVLGYGTAKKDQSVRRDATRGKQGKGWGKTGGSE